MLSLSDELLRFEKLTFENNLDGIITVEDGFSNGSVTVHDLVKENHFIINEFKKMKNVFINYTKINQKIYDRVIEYELNFGANILKLGNLTNFFEKTVEGTIDTMKEIYEDTVHANKLSERNLDEMLKPINKSLAEKVDLTYFIQQLKALNGSSEHDSLELLKFDHSKSLEQNEGEERDISNNINPDQTKLPIVKSHKISLQQMNNIKQSVLQQMQQSSKYMENRFEDLKQAFDIEKHNTKLNLEQLYASMTNQLNQKLQEEKEYKNLQIKRLQKDIDQKTSVQIWEKHKVDIVRQINDTSIKMIQENIEEIKNINQKQDKLHKRTMNELRKSLETLLESSQQKILKAAKSETDKVAQKIPQINSLIENLKEEFLNFRMSSSQALDIYKKENKNQHVQFNNMLQELSQSIDKISINLEVNILKAVMKRFQDNFNQLTGEFDRIKSIEVETSKKILRIFQMLKDVKEVVSKKANFADICHLFEKKASKDDISEIKDLIRSETPRMQTIQLPAKTHKHSNKNTTTINEFQLKRRSQTSRVISPDMFQAAQNSFILGLSKTQRIKKQKRFQSNKLKYRPATAQITIFN